MFLLIFSSLIGMIFVISQNKIIENNTTIIFGILGFIGIIISIVRLSTLQKEFFVLVKELEKE